MIGCVIGDKRIYPMRAIIRNDPISKIDLSTTPDSIPTQHWNFARQQLSSCPDGTKLRYYQRSIAKYYNVHLFKKISLSHAFMRKEENIFVKINGRYMRHDTAPYQALPVEERQFAESYFAEKKEETVLSTHEKINIPYCDETGNDIHLNHAFIILNGALYALSGYGHVLENNSATKIKWAMTENGEKFILKIFHLSPKNEEDTLAIKKEWGHLLAIAKKSTDQKTIHLFPYLGIDLFAFFDQLSNPISPEMVRTLFNIFFQTILAVEKLHKNGILHRDIKPENILWDEKQQIIHLIDFDFAQKINSDNNTLYSADLCGTPVYLAPELLKILPYPVQKKLNILHFLRNEKIIPAIKLFNNGEWYYCYSEKTDIYALGKTIKHLLSRLDNLPEQFFIEIMRFTSTQMSHLYSEKRLDFDLIKMVSIFCLCGVNQGPDLKTRVETQLKQHQCSVTQFELAEFIVQYLIPDIKSSQKLRYVANYPYLFYEFQKNNSLYIYRQILIQWEAVDRDTLLAISQNPEVYQVAKEVRVCSNNEAIQTVCHLYELLQKKNIPFQKRYMISCLLKNNRMHRDVLQYFIAQNWPLPKEGEFKFLESVWMLAQLMRFIRNHKSTTEECFSTYNNQQLFQLNLDCVLLKKVDDEIQALFSAHLHSDALFDEKKISEVNDKIEALMRKPVPVHVDPSPTESVKRIECEYP